jgi:lipoyl synthase
MSELAEEVLMPTLNVDPHLMELRKSSFSGEITFYAPGFRRYATSEYDGQSATEFVAISVTGSACALQCDHCRTNSLKGMIHLPDSGKSLYDLCAGLAERGTRGVLVSGGSDRQGHVPLLTHMADIDRIVRELGMLVRVHPGVPDEDTCNALAAAGIDGVMLDVIGDDVTIRDVYHLDRTPDEYEEVLAWFEQLRIPTYPHIVLGHYFGEMRGEWNALDIIRRHLPAALVLVVLTPLQGTPMAETQLPSLNEIADFLRTARTTLPEVPLILGCARPAGPQKSMIDRIAIAAGVNGIAYPADGALAQARLFGLTPRFVNACCGIIW